jgi:tRNA A-37 threonylcarbamoyl transferase component Bud32
VKLPGYEELLASREGEVVATARTRLTRRLRIDGSVCYLKTQRFPLAPRYLLRPSAYVREARAARAMNRIGIRVPEILLASERRRYGFLRDAVLLTREVAGAVDLAEWDRRGRPPLPGIPPFDAILAEVLGLVERAHRSGCRFGDLKPRNLLAAPADASGAHVVVLDQRRFHRCRLRLHSRARDLRYLAPLLPAG